MIGDGCWMDVAAACSLAEVRVAVICRFCARELASELPAGQTKSVQK